VDRLSGLSLWIIACLVFGPLVFAINAPASGAEWTVQGALYGAGGVVAFGSGVLGLIVDQLARLGLDGFDRHLVDETPQILCGYFRSLPEAEAKERTAQYIGRPLRVCGPVGETKVGWIQKYLAFPVAHFGNSLVAAGVSSRSVAPLRRLKPGDYVCVVGRITNIGKFGLFLDDARIVKDDRPTQIPRS
jgi:hypothetical protein